jgi:hypothetical protein
MLVDSVAKVKKAISTSDLVFLLQQIAIEKSVI